MSDAVHGTSMAALSSIIDELTDIAKEAIGDPRTRDIETSHTPADATRFRVATKNGAIDVHPAEGDDLHVDATVETRRDDDDLDAVSLDLTETDDLLTLTVEFPDEDHAMSVDLDIALPDALALDSVETKNGKIAVRDVHGDVRIDTKNGKITVDSVDGTVALHAKNGAITVRDTHVQDVASKNGTIDLHLPGLAADATVEAKNGKLTIAVPADTDADFTLDATTGKADVEGLTCLIDESTRTHVTGEIGTGGPHLDARTKNGSVTLRAR